MGHNGAGKSTMINTISGMISVTSGDVRINDWMLSLDLDTIRKRLGVVS